MMKTYHKYQSWILYGAIYMIFLLGHAFILKDIKGVWVDVDSVDYYEFSKQSIMEIIGEMGVRTPVSLIFYKLFGVYESYNRWHFINDDILLLYSQSVIYLAAFSLLAFACAKSGQNGKGRFLLFIFPLLFSFVPSILRWNFRALSESLCISIFVVFIALWIMFLTTKRLSWLIGMAIIALLWAGVRDTNAYVLVMIALVIMATLIRPCSLKRSSMMTLCIWFVCIFALSDFSANTGNRWVFPFYNNISQRILPVPEHVAYFSNQGMPINFDLMARSGKWANSDNRTYDRSLNLDKFRIWMHEHGKITYIKFLIDHFTYTVTAPVFHVARDFLGFVYHLQIHPTEAKYKYIVGVSSSHTPIALIYFVIGYSVAVCYAFVWWRRKQLYQCPYLAVPLVMILLSAPHAWITWHGDAIETARHTLTAFVQFQVGFILLLLYVWDHSRKGRIRPPEKTMPGRQEQEPTGHPVCESAARSRGG